MPDPSCSDEEFIELFRGRGPINTARFLGVTERSVLARRRRLEKRLQIDIDAPSRPDNSDPKILLIDIETAPNRVYTWGLWNQNVGLSQIEEPGYTLCWSAKWFGEKDIVFRSVQKHGRDRMLKDAHDMMCEADLIVHYNGSKFDIPTLNQEFLADGMKPPSPSIEIDLLTTVRGKFRLQSNKLDFVARHLNLDGKLDHKGMELWRGCMAGNKADWKTMEAYNKQDVLLLEKVYEAMIPWIKHHPSLATYTVSLFKSCPRCGSTNMKKNGFYHTKTQAYQQYQCGSCGGFSRERATALDKEKRRSVLASV